MKHLLSTMQNDVIIQVRKQFYSVAVLISAASAAVFCLFINPDYVRHIVPPVMLLFVGGTTLIYAGILIFEEKEKGILKALVLSPLKLGEYIWSKVISLTFLAALEMAIMIIGPLVYFHYADGIELPDLFLLTGGIVIINLIYALLGVVLSVRFRKMTDFLIPAVFVIILLELPILYFAGLVRSNLLLAVPSSPPVMLIQGAFIELETWKWVYTISGLIVIITGLALWARSTFYKYIRLRME